MKLCAECSAEISAARIKALPEADKCTACAARNDEPKVIGLMVWSHKTAPEIEIGTELAKKLAGKNYNYGPNLPLNSYEGRQAQQARNSFDSHELAETARKEQQTNSKPKSVPSGLEPISGQPSRCHPDRPRFNPAGMCLPCALEYQKRRVVK